MNNIVAANDPEAATKLIEQAIAGDGLPEPEAAPARQIVAPPETTIELPCGLLTLDGLLRDVEVRELNGFDEEDLAKVGMNPGQLTQRLLERGVVSIGGEKPTKDRLDNLLAGDVDAIILAIRAATYGPTIPSAFACPHCTSPIEIELDLRTDVEHKRLDTADDQRFIVSTKRGDAVVRLPDWSTQRDVFSRDDATEPELATVVLRHCVESVGGMPVFDETSVRKLPASVRGELIAALSERVAGARLNDVSKPCPDCGKDIALPLSVMSLFRF